jgi:hypothetical protein
MMHSMGCKSVLIAFLLLFFAAAAVSGDVTGGKWELVGFTKYRDALFIDRSSLSQTGGNTFTVMAKIAPSRKSKYFKEIRKELKKAKKSDKTFRYAEILTELDCAGSRIRYLTISYHRKNAGVIHKAGNPRAEWRPIVSGSLWHALEKSVCSHGP